MSLAILWQVLYYAWVGSEVVIAIGTRTRNSSGNVRDRGTLYLLWAVIFISMTAGLTWSEISSFGSIPDIHWMRSVALCLFFFGLVLRWSAVVSLGKSFSSNVAIHSTQTVLKTGLYRWMRHPSYTGLILLFIATGLRTRNWVSFLIVTVPTTAALLYRIHVEEIALRDHFGEEYIAYSRQTRRLIPGVY
jgi:protein-S-isoprenylcysteine O-methyltransferase Ste14